MRKNKIFNVDTTKFKAMQLKDNPEFYSRDTDAFLTFTVPDESFEFDNALLYLINIDDGSVVTEIETEILGQANVEFEITPEIMAHYGRWRGQIVFQKDGEKASSAIFEFVIKRFLTDERPPTLNEVESIAKLRREAKELIAELSDTYDDLLENGVLQTNINNKLTELETQYSPKLTEVSAQLAQKANEADLEIERQRISQIVSLEEGSTTGDAELEDIRIGYDGTVYPTAGDAVRSIGAFMTEQNESWVV